MRFEHVVDHFLRFSAEISHFFCFEFQTWIRILKNAYYRHNFSLINLNYYAEKRTRTSTGFTPQASETCVSTNSTISAESSSFAFILRCNFFFPLPFFSPHTPPPAPPISS